MRPLKGIAEIIRKRPIKNILSIELQNRICNDADKSRWISMGWIVIAGLLKDQIIHW